MTARRLVWCAGSMLALLASFTVAAATDDPAEDQEKPDRKADQRGPALKALQGTWNFTMPDGAEGTFDFEGRKVTTKVGDRTYVSQVRLRRNAKPYPGIDFQIEEGPDDSAGKTALGIYKMEDGKLILCVAMPDRERPEEFKADGDEVFLFEMTKKK